MTLNVTANAFKRVGELIELQHNTAVALRISVEGGGCSGYRYKYELTTEISPEDQLIEKERIKVIIDPISQPFLEGCTLDFTEQLGSSYFEIKNPNASAKCGCGSSFAV